MARESGSIDIAPETTIDTRRDPLVVRDLTLKEASCGYTEDQDPGTIQGLAGAGCHYVCKDAEARQAMNAQVDEWMNASNDLGVPMLGVPKAPAATP